MAHTKQRKVIATVMAMAASALVVDKLMLGGSSPEEASAETPGALSGAGKAERTGKNETRASKGDAWAAQLLEHARRRHALSVSGIGDGFALPARLVPVKVAAGVPAPVAAPVPERDWTQVKITTVIMTGGQEGALIDGRFVRLGEQVHGMRLVKVDQRGVLLEDQTHQVELRLPGSSPDDAHRRVTVRKRE